MTADSPNATGTLGPEQVSSVPTPSRSYGVWLALTFDEFGLWLHMGGS